jgi:hypothetical protein
MQDSIVRHARLVTYVNAAGKMAYKDTGLRVSKPTELFLAYRAIELKMFGTLSRKHYGFSLPEADLFGDRGRQNVIRVVPAYHCVYVTSKDSGDTTYKRIRSYDHFREGSSLRKLVNDLSQSRLSFWMNDDTPLEGAGPTGHGPLDPLENASFPSVEKMLSDLENAVGVDPSLVRNLRSIGQSIDLLEQRIGRTPFRGSKTGKR